MAATTAPTANQILVSPNVISSIRTSPALIKIHIIGSIMTPPFFIDVFMITYFKKNVNDNVYFTIF